ARRADRTRYRRCVERSTEVPAIRRAERLPEQSLQRSADAARVDGAGALRDVLPYAARLEDSRSVGRTLAVSRSDSSRAACLDIAEAGISACAGALARAEG